MWAKMLKGEHSCPGVATGSRGGVRVAAERSLPTEDVVRCRQLLGVAAG